MVKRQTAEYWRQHVAAWERSGLTGLGYSEVHGVSSGSLYAWKSKLCRDGAGQGATRFVPAEVVPAVTPQTKSEGVLEVVVGNGRTLRIRGLVQAEVLQRTLLALEGPRGQ